MRFFRKTAALWICVAGAACGRSSAQPGADAKVQPVTTCAGTAANYKSISGLAAIAPLPDPFTAIDGSRIAGADQWASRRVAPRALLVIENTSMVWLGAESTFSNSMAAHDVWQAPGISDHMGFSQVGHPDHCGWSGAQKPEVTAYVQKFLVGGGTDDTNVLKTDGGFTLDRATWAPWTVPAL